MPDPKHLHKLIKNNWMFALAVIIFVVAAVKFSSDRGLLKLPKQTPSTQDSGRAVTIKDYCNNPDNTKTMGKESCYSKQFQALAQEVGHIQAFTVLHQLQKIDSSTIGCHLISHGIGWGSFKKEPASWQEDIQTIEPSCNYGGPHGVIEAYLATQPEHTLNKQTLPEFCGANPRADCNHIIGHLTLVETRSDVPKALDLCDAFVGNPIQLDHCYTGVFMEYQTALNLIEHGFAPKDWLKWPERVPELEKMCRTYQGEKGKACWKEIVHAALVKFHNDPKTIFDFCATAQVKDGSMECKRHSIGIMAASKQFDLPNLKSMCDLVQKDDPNFKADCYVQLVASTLSTVPDQKDKVKVFCESLNATYQQSCLNQANYFNNSTPRNND